MVFTAALLLESFEITESDKLYLDRWGSRPLSPII